MQDSRKHGRDYEASDADSDLEELEGDIERFDQSVRQFMKDQGRQGIEKPTRNGRGGKRGSRGPRKAAEPRGDIKARLAKVNRAFMNGQNDAALGMVFEVIRINAETHQAWTALASIFREQGLYDKALMSMVYAAHLRPKDVAGWLQCADFALDLLSENDPSCLTTARLCYSAALRADSRNPQARLGRAIACHRQGHVPSAIAGYKAVLQQRPLDIDVVRRLAEACIDIGSDADDVTIYCAIDAYQSCLQNPLAFKDITWHDAGIYAELHASLHRFEKAVRMLKSVSRRLVGRGGDEELWDLWSADDREWDMESERRQEVHGFDIGRFTVASYGEALPTEQRARLCIYRFQLEHDSEAFVSNAHAPTASVQAAVQLASNTRLIYAQKHLDLLPLDSVQIYQLAGDIPSLVLELASLLFQRRCFRDARRLYEIVRKARQSPGESALLQLGRCHVQAGDLPSAEECFLAVIDTDQGNIEARMELATLYENAKEDVDALIFAAEAIALRSSRREGTHQKLGPNWHGGGQGQEDWRAPRSLSGLMNHRFRPRRLVDPEKRRQDEQTRTLRVVAEYEEAIKLRARIRAGEQGLLSDWLIMTRNLFEEFRALNRLYSWDSFLGALEKKNDDVAEATDADDLTLGNMVQRLSKSKLTFWKPWWLAVLLIAFCP